MPSLEISATCIAPDACTWLVNSRHPRTLHVFDHVCNLINERREVLSIVTPQIGNGPFNLVVEDEVLFSELLNIESLVSVPGNQLMLGDLTINAADAKLWSPRPDWNKLHTSRENILYQLTKLPIANYQECGLDTSLTHLPWRVVPGTNVRDYSTTVFNSKLSITNYQFSHSLLSSLATANLPSSLTSTRKLAGLGAGLTPSGDDFIMGAVYAAWIIQPPEVAGVLVEKVANTAAPLTTSLSAAWLRSVGKGEAGILWHEFFDALITCKDIQLPMTKLLSVGHTSGADALEGFMGLLIYWGEHCSNLWEYNQT